MDATPQTTAPRGQCVVQIGLGNIGGFVAGMLARADTIEELTLIDRDLYDETNVASQDILVADVGRPKAVAQADRLRRINPRLRVEAIVGDVESVPLARLRADCIVACLDSRRARQYVNQAAWRLGVPWVDAGVNADDHLLARVNVYVPGSDRPCLECAWGPSDYQHIEQAYPCDGPASAPAATRAPAGLGGLAGALQVLECQKLLSGDWQHAAIGKQILVDAANHRHFVTSIRRSPVCLFDHQTWEIDCLDRGAERLALKDAFALAATSAASAASAELPSLGIEGQVFVNKLTCPACGETRQLLWHLSSRLGAERRCASCGHSMLATAFDLAEQLHESDLAGGALAAPLSALGMRDGDVVTLRGAGGCRHVEVGSGRGSQREVIHG